MTLRRKIIFRFILSLFFFFLSLNTKYCFLNTVYAADEFETAYQITYTVNQDTSVRVEQKISLTNKLANVYATEYQINLGTTKIREVTAWDEAGAITPQVQIKDNAAIINLLFNQKATGKGETLNFTLSYLSDDYALQNGQVLEIGIPRISDSQTLKAHSVLLQVPQSFEKPIFILPQPQKTSQKNNFNLYYFTQDQLINQSITASFGEKQIFSFKLTYHLENDKNAAHYFEISLPPDTPFQKLYYEDLSPSPENIKIDPDGNWLAQYLVAPQTTLAVVALGSAEIFLEPQTEITEQPLDDFEPYLKSLPFWEADNEQIKGLAEELKTVKKIYDFVVDNLNYDYARINQTPERLGALKVLNNKDSAVCLEFTDLFIALCRAAGIPSREVNGFAYTTNPQLRPLSLTQDILHAWPEYYDKEQKLWLAVDPTWEKTTAGIDFFHQSSLNHFSFVFHGKDSLYPYAPGSYEAWLQPTKDVEVAFGEKPVKKEKFNLELAVSPKVLAGTKIKGKLKIKNLGNTALYETGFSPLPPFALYEEEVSLGKINLFSRGQVSVKAEFKDQKVSQEVEIVSPWLVYLLPYGGGFLLGLGFFTLLLKISKPFKINLIR
jgi:transglutaminase-like putative cysteine protease